MRITRCYVPFDLQAGRKLVLPDHTAQHLVRVLRLSVGQALILFNGDGSDYHAKLISHDKRHSEVEISHAETVDNESPVRITLAQGVARGEKMDWILQKATELGVQHFAPVLTERTEVKLDAERADKRVEHWIGVVISACEQSKRTRIPSIDMPVALNQFAARDNSSIKLALDPEGQLSVADLSSMPVENGITLVVGPEGGLGERDLSILNTGGYRGLRLGPRILRTETAGLAAISAIQAVLGDFA
jgi:16S rRNA (uracil1498-N3)-methyltransferase